MQLTEQRQQAETALVRLQARLAADTNQLLAAKLPKPEAEEPVPGGAGAAGQEQQANGGAAGAAAGTGMAGGQAGAAAINPFLAAPWGELGREEQQQQQHVAAPPANAPAAGTAGGEQPAATAGTTGPTGEDRPGPITRPCCYMTPLFAHQCS